MYLIFFWLKYDIHLFIGFYLTNIHHLFETKRNMTYRICLAFSLLLINLYCTCTAGMSIFLLFFQFHRQSNKMKIRHHTNPFMSADFTKMYVRSSMNSSKLDILNLSYSKSLKPIFTNNILRTQLHHNIQFYII